MEPSANLTTRSQSAQRPNVNGMKQKDKVEQVQNITNRTKETNLIVDYITNLYRKLKDSREL